MHRWLNKELSETRKESLYAWSSKPQILRPSGSYLCCGQIFQTHSCWIATARPHFITKILSIPSHSHSSPAGADFPWLPFSVPHGPVLLSVIGQWSGQAEISNWIYKARDCWEDSLSSFEDPRLCGRSARSGRKPQPLLTPRVLQPHFAQPPYFPAMSLCVTHLDPANNGLLDHHREIWLFPWQREDRPNGTCHYELLNGTLKMARHIWTMTRPHVGDVVAVRWCGRS